MIHSEELEIFYWYLSSS